MICPVLSLFSRAPSGKRDYHKNLLLRQHIGSFWPEGKAILSSGVSDAIVPDRLEADIVSAARPLRVRDLMRAVKTESNVVQFVKETAFVNAASPQVEGSAKSESSLTFAVVNGNVRTIAHWVPASRQVLDDMDGLREYIDSRLLYGLKLVEETQILAGDNLGENLYGIIPQASAYDAALNVSGDTKLDRLRHAILQAELADEAVDGIVINPKDAHDVELLKATDGQYIVADPAGAIAYRTIWGKPVVKSRSIAAGSFLVGGFATAATIFDRQESVVEASAEHADFWTRNLVAIRCEERICLAIRRPAAFIVGSFS